MASRATQSATVAACSFGIAMHGRPANSVGKTEIAITFRIVNGNATPTTDVASKSDVVAE